MFATRARIVIHYSSKKESQFYIGMFVPGELPAGKGSKPIEVTQFY
jgi:hypothetical protein